MDEFNPSRLVRLVDITCDMEKAGVDKHLLMNLIIECRDNPNSGYADMIEIWDRSYKDRIKIEQILCQHISIDKKCKALQAICKESEETNDKKVCD